MEKLIKDMEILDIFSLCLGYINTKRYRCVREAENIRDELMSNSLGMIRNG